MRISDWSSDVCSSDLQDPSDLLGQHRPLLHHRQEQEEHPRQDGGQEIRPRRAEARDLQGRQDQVTHWRERAKRARLCQCVIPECFCRGSSDLKNTRRKAGFLLPGYFTSRPLTRRFATPSPASPERADITTPCLSALPGNTPGGSHSHKTHLTPH